MDANLTRLPSQPAADGAGDLAAPAATVLPLLLDAGGLSSAIVVAVDPAGLRVVAVSGTQQALRVGHTWSLPDPLWSALTQADQLEPATSNPTVRHSPMALDLPAADAVVAVLPIGDGTCNEPIAALVAAVEPGRSEPGRARSSARPPACWRRCGG